MSVSTTACNDYPLAPGWVWTHQVSGDPPHRAQHRERNVEVVYLNSLGRWTVKVRGGALRQDGDRLGMKAHLHGGAPVRLESSWEAVVVAERYIRECCGPMEDPVLPEDDDAAPDTESSPSIDLPDPIEDPDEIVENDLHDRIRDDAAFTLSMMTDALQGGRWDPVRALHLITSYASTQKRLLAELDEDGDVGGDDDTAMGQIYPMAMPPHRRLGRRRRRNRRVADPMLPVAYGGGHGGGEDAARQVMGVIEGLDKRMQLPQAVKSLTQSLVAATDLGDEILMGRLKRQLDQALAQLEESGGAQPDAPAHVPQVIDDDTPNDP